MEGEHGEGREAAAADEVDPLTGRRAALRVVEGRGGGVRRRGTRGTAAGGGCLWEK